MNLRLFAVWASLGGALVIGGPGCGGGSSGGAGGKGGAAAPMAGTTGTAGAPGTAGTTGAGGAGVGGSVGTTAASCGALPACVASVVAACPLAGDCLTAASSAGDTLTHNVCFGSGSKVVRNITTDPNASTQTITISVTKDGVVCYTLDGTNVAPGPQTLAFKDASGTTLATFTSDPSTFPPIQSVTCAGGQPVVVSDFGTCGNPQNPEPDSCMGGRCVAP